MTGHPRNDVISTIPQVQPVLFPSFFSYNVPFPFGTEEVTLDIDHGAGHEKFTPKDA
jgi:hypothetical protein